MPQNLLDTTSNLISVPLDPDALTGDYDYKKANTVQLISPFSSVQEQVSTKGVKRPIVKNTIKPNENGGRARIITVEGIDGAGKTTGAKIIAEKLADMGYKVLNITTEKLTDESKAIRQLFISGAMGNATVDAMGMLVSAYLNSIITTQVHPNLDRYDYIIMDRSFISTLVYQRHSIIGAQCAGFIEDQLPLDIVFLFDIDPVQATMRLEANGKELDHFEMGNIVEKGTERRYWYNQMFIRKRPNYMVKVNANKSLEWVTNRLHEQCELIVSKSVGKVWFNEV